MSRDNKGVLELIAVAVMFLLVTGVVLYNLEIESVTADDQAAISAQTETVTADAITTTSSVSSLSSSALSASSAIAAEMSKTDVR